MYKSILKIPGKKTCTSTGCLESKKHTNSNIILEKEKKIQDRWAEYISKLLEDHRKVYSIMKRNFAGPPIMKLEICSAIREMK